MVTPLPWAYLTLLDRAPDGTRPIYFRDRNQLRGFVVGSVLETLQARTILEDAIDAYNDLRNQEPQ